MTFKCRDCRYFKLSHVDSPFGSCHRFPPNNEEGCFPRVETTDWCGEHSALQGHWAEYDLPDTPRISRLVRFLP